jgi:hypothetical protein
VINTRYLEGAHLSRSFSSLTHYNGNRSTFRNVVVGKKLKKINLYKIAVNFTVVVFEVLTTVAAKSSIFRNITPCSLEKVKFDILTFNGLQGVVSQKLELFMFLVPHVCFIASIPALKPTQTPTQYRTGCYFNGSKAVGSSG